jgi:hypothetical protein
VSNIDPGSVVPQEPGRNPPRHVKAGTFITGKMILGLVVAAALMLGVVGYFFNDGSRLATKTDEPATTIGQGENTPVPP